MVRASLFLTAFVMVPLAACSSMLKERPGITYAAHAEQLGINPVYPPREDLQVGDVYAVEVHSLNERFAAKSAFVAPVNMSREITAYLGTRYKFHETKAVAPVEGSSDHGLKQWQSDVTNGSGVQPAMLQFTTLPVAGFPRIEVNSGVSIGVGGQPTGLAVAFGFAAAKTLKMSLQYSSVTSYEVPPPVAIRALQRYCDQVEQDRCARSEFGYWINQKYQLDQDDDGYVWEAGALMVTKVYLARKITYTFNDATLAAAATATVAAERKAQEAPMLSPADINAVIASKDPELVTAMGALVRAVSTYAQQAREGEAAVTIAAITTNSVAIEETFPRPVVIGYEGVSMVRD